MIDPLLSVSDVLDMVDVLVEGSEGLDEEIGVSLDEDMALLTFPFSAVVPAALEARNKLLLGTENAAGTCVVRMLWAHQTSWVSGRQEVGFQGLWNDCRKPGAARVQAQHGELPGGRAKCEGGNPEAGLAVGRWVIRRTNLK